MAGVTLEHVTKKFGQVVAVDDLSLEIRDQEFLVLVGPSGCGKSTSLRIVAGLEDPTSGDVYIGDRWVNDLAPRDRDIAMVFQSYALYPHMSVYDNLAFGLRMRKTPRGEIDRRVKMAADLLDIGELLDRKPRQLSGGQRQRVALGRAIVREPQVFLMDEPLSNLDAKLRVATRAELIKLHQRLETTVIYVTHDQVEAMTMGTRIAVLNDGLLQQLDTPLNLYYRPANRFVAGFIGSPAMNLLNARVLGSADGMYVDTGNFQLPLPEAKAGPLQPYLGKEVALGIRPENIRDKRFVSYDPSIHSDLTAKVDVYEPLGQDVVIHVLVGSQLLVTHMDSRTQVRSGQEMQIVVELDRLHFFDPQTETTITN